MLPVSAVQSSRSLVSTQNGTAIRCLLHTPLCTPQLTHVREQRKIHRQAHTFSWQPSRPHQHLSSCCCAGHSKRNEAVETVQPEVLPEILPERDYAEVSHITPAQTRRGRPASWVLAGQHRQSTALLSFAAVAAAGLFGRLGNLVVTQSF